MKPQALVFRSLALTVLLAGVTFAQTPASQSPEQSPVKPPGPTVVRWQDGAANSDLQVLNGRTHLILQHGGFEVSVWLAELEQMEISDLDIVNNTQQRVEFAPSLVTLDLVAPGHRSFPYLDPDKLAASIRKGNHRWLEVLAAGLTGFGNASQQSQTTGTVTMDDGRTGTVKATTTTHDNSAGDRAAENAERNRERRSSKASDLTKYALRDNTVMPHRWVIGQVFFAFPKHFTKDFKKKEIELDLRVPVGDYVFEFPYRWTLGK